MASSNKSSRVAPLRPRQSLLKERFPVHFNAFRPQAYSDTTTSRGASSHNIRSIGWNPLGTLIATGAADKTLRVWNPEKALIRYSTELKGHTAPIEKVAFNPVKDAELCSVSNDGVVKFWDVRTKNCINEVKGLGDTFTLAWDPEGESLIVGNKTDKIHILSPTQSTPLASHQQPVQTNQISFCWGREKVFMSTGDGRVRILSYPDLEPVMTYNYDRSKIDGPASSSSLTSSTATTTTTEDETSPLSSSLYPNEFTMKGHTSSCLSVELSPNGKYLASGGTDSVICMWDTTDWICQRTFTDMVGPVRSLSFTWDGYYVAGGSDEGTGIECYHVESGERVYTFKTASPSPVVAWAPMRYQLAYSDLGQLRIVGIDLEGKK